MGLLVQTPRADVEAAKKGIDFKLGRRPAPSSTALFDHFRGFQVDSQCVDISLFGHHRIFSLLRG